MLDNDWKKLKKLGINNLRALLREKRSDRKGKLGVSCPLLTYVDFIIYILPFRSNTPPDADVHPTSNPTIHAHTSAPMKSPALKFAGHFVITTSQPRQPLWNLKPQRENQPRWISVCCTPATFRMCSMRTSPICLRSTSNCVLSDGPRKLLIHTSAIL
jgi:hypothetical protein